MLHYKPMERFRAVVTGAVQGVGYRAFARSTAMSLGIVCIARNLPDGSVEILAESSPDRLSKLKQALRAGPPHARVEQVTVYRAQLPRGMYTYTA